MIRMFAGDDRKRSRRAGCSSRAEDDFEEDEFEADEFEMETSIGNDDVPRKHSVAV